MATTTYEIFGYRVTVRNRHEVIVYSCLMAGSQEEISDRIRQQYPANIYTLEWRDYTREEFEALQLLGF